MSHFIPSCSAVLLLLSLVPLASAHSYSHINGNDWVITCNDGTEINVTGSETQVYNSVRSSCRGHEAAPVDSVAEATGEAGLASANHNSARSNKNTVAPDLTPAPPPPRRLDQAPGPPAPASGQ
jgi:hypothetical protein